MWTLWPAIRHEDRRQRIRVATRVAVDLMGSERPPHEIFEAVLAVGNELENGDALTIIGQHEIIPALRLHYGSSLSLFECVTTDESIEMEEAPLLAVRRKKKSSLAAGMRLLKEGKIDAFVSTGNTGALVASAILHLPMLPGIDRPALLVMMPAERGKVVVLDVGANIAPKPQHLVSYAILGTLYRKLMFEEVFPTVGLLNIGTEEQKGTKELQETYHLLLETFKESFLGNIEGRQVFHGKIDVLVTDGFTGNVFLKTSEGISTFLAEYLGKNFDVKNIVSHLYQQFNYAEHPGAFLCGVDGVVVKCHGFSDQTALMNGIRGAFTLVKKNVIGHLKTELLNL
jgi:phosphate acyltransferase